MGGLAAQTAGNCLQQFIGLEGLAERGGCAELFRDVEEIGLTEASAARYRDDRAIARQDAQLHDRLNTLHLRHDDVADDEVGPALAKRSQALAALRCALHLVALSLQYPRQRLP